jgi:hypothetical protein
MKVKGNIVKARESFVKETYSQVDCPTVIGWYKQALEICGTKSESVEIVEESCRGLGGDVCADLSCQVGSTSRE